MDDFIPIKNIMNEWYARDISKKRRISNKIKGNAGEPLSQPPYGYVKDPQDKKRWIIDPEAASVVREIFKLYLDGNGEDTIARIMQEEQHLMCTKRRGRAKTKPNDLSSITSSSGIWILIPRSAIRTTLPTSVRASPLSVFPVSRRTV
jgi:DNA invertase Pin-like site-specific DNA recombinase